MPLELEPLQIFLKVAELRSFTRAGEQLGMGKARVSLQLSALETELGTRLFHRSTRVVRLTPDGERLLPRARRLVAEGQDLAEMFRGARELRGHVRLDLPIAFARDLIIPRLPELFGRHPALELTVSSTDRLVAAVREGFDCILRVGAPRDPSLVAKRLGVLPMANCASPLYLERYGTPTKLQDLAGHFVVHYSASEADTPSFEYRDAAGDQEYPMRCTLTVNNSDAYWAACQAGLGIIQLPRSARLLASFAAGTLVEVLPALTSAPMPVTLLHTHGRNVPRRVRAVMNWLSDVMMPALSA